MPQSGKLKPRDDRGRALKVTQPVTSVPQRACVDLKSGEPLGSKAGEAVWEMLEKGFLFLARGWILTPSEGVRGTGGTPGLHSNPAPPYAVQPKAGFLTSLSLRFLLYKSARTSSISKAVCWGL